MNARTIAGRGGLFLLFLMVSFAPAASQAPKGIAALYSKTEVQIPMRDGAKLFTAIYAPRDQSRKYPFLLTRTPYSIVPYGEAFYRETLGPSPQFVAEGFIFVYQDARGRNKSEGEFQQVRPHVPVKRGPTDVDESTDTYDTIEWLLRNVPNNNGRAGMIGISQPGFHVAAGMIDTHPALVAASPQAPTADYYLGDDDYHNGAFMLAANFWFYSAFLPRKGGPSLPRIRRDFDVGTPDGYDFFLKMGPLAEVNQKYFKGESDYWQEVIDHPNYDAFWQKRSLWKHMKNVRCAVLNVGGWFDAEDPIGPFHIYRAVEKSNPGIVNAIVMGPWSHGGWARGEGARLGNLDFGSKTALFFQEQIQFPFFMHYLKDAKGELPEAWMFLTGKNEWRKLGEWPPKGLAAKTFYLSAGGALRTEPPAEARAWDEYISDPNRPVPYVGYTATGMNGDYMTEDQRFAAQRPDVLLRDVHDHAQVLERQARHDRPAGRDRLAELDVPGDDDAGVGRHDGRVADAFARLEKGSLWLYGAYIEEYSHGGLSQHAPRRPRQLLLHAHELRKLAQATETGGKAIVALRMYFKQALVKVEIALASGKKQFDKREDIKRREQNQEARRAVKFRR